MRETYGAKDERSLLMRFHSQTAGVSLTAQQPLNNIVRTAVEALAAVLGGTQSLHTNSFDEALALPTEEAVRVALRTQQIIAHETGVTNTIDPLGGSYFIEALTDRMEEAAYEYFRKIDELGGMVAAIEQNYPQREIADASFRYQQEVDSGQRIIVGVNDYRLEDEEELEILRIPAELERKQIGRVQAVRAGRDGEAVESDARRAADGGGGRREPDGAAARLRAGALHARARSSSRSSAFSEPTRDPGLLGACANRLSLVIAASSSRRLRRDHRGQAQGQLLQAGPGRDRQGRQGPLGWKGSDIHNVAIKKPGSTTSPSVRLQDGRQVQPRSARSGPGRSCARTIRARCG